MTGSLATDEAGISLVEVLVSIFVLGLVMAALSQTLVTSLVSLRGQEGEIKATALANEVLEQVQGVTWENAGLCDSAATGNEASTHFGGTTFEGQNLVIIPDADPTCSVPDPDRLVPSDTYARDGITYTAVLAVTWEDDPIDDGAVSDPDPQDYKRIVVDVSWQIGTETRTVRAESRRAPIPIEDAFLAELVPDIIAIRNTPDESAVVGSNLDPFELQAVALEEQTSVVATWVDRGGATETRNLTSSDGGFTWSFDVPTNVGPFRNGETVFTFTAMDPGGQQLEAVYRGLFLHQLELLSLTAPDAIEVLADGTVCPFTVTVHVRGTLKSDDVTATFTPGTNAEAMLAAGEDVNGAIFSLDYPIQPAYDWSGIGTTDLTIAVQRVADLATLTASKTGITVTQGVLLCSS